MLTEVKISNLSMFLNNYLAKKLEDELSEAIILAKLMDYKVEVSEYSQDFISSSDIAYVKVLHFVNVKSNNFNLIFKLNEDEILRTISLNGISYQSHSKEMFKPIKLIKEML